MGREGARGWSGEAMVRGRVIQSGGIGREGGLRKGTSEEGTELCMDGARGRGEGKASGGEREQRREVEEQLREDRQRKGDREGGKLQGR